MYFIAITKKKVVATAIETYSQLSQIGFPRKQTLRGRLGCQGLLGGTFGTDPYIGKRKKQDQQKEKATM